MLRFVEEERTISLKQRTGCNGYFMWQLDWATGHLDIRANSILRYLGGCFQMRLTSKLDRQSRLSLPNAWASSNELKSSV